MPLHTRSTVTWRSAGVTPCSKPPPSFQSVADVGGGHLAEAADVVRRRAIPAIGDGLAAETNTMSYPVLSETCFSYENYDSMGTVSTRG
ncbi:hypothetical protein GCM10023259_057300 [Thermocatellispora tengchongensis]